MAAQIVKEWSGINSFAPATQTKLLELLGKLKQEFFFAIKPIERAIKTDIARESRLAWEMRDASLASRKF